MWNPPTNKRYLFNSTCKTLYTAADPNPKIRQLDGDDSRKKIYSKKWPAFGFIHCNYNNGNTGLVHLESAVREPDALRLAGQSTRARRLRASAKNTSDKGRND
ncbi:hypothetical protein EVAR_38137_1 [Eumeta japonica]|uniref:Uncharacterized protein n=1 Tax=Eumeta variegata TaxID=151549 RepID=A0A4C1YRR0_EUMVA|nr:hypothetical protein EVAR_38137_1 [Eumeta japonica]